MWPDRSSFVRAFFATGLLTLILKHEPISSHAVVRKPANISCGTSRLYYPEDGRCYYDTRRGLCGEQMRFGWSSVKEQDVGRCKCDWMGPWICNDRHQVFWKEASRCYYTYVQGPCKLNEWLVPYGNESAKCEINPCLAEYNAQKLVDSENKPSGLDGHIRHNFVFPHEGKCHGSLNFCPSSQKYFTFSKSVPQCSEYGVCGVSYVADSKCPDGSEPDSVGGCEPLYH